MLARLTPAIAAIAVLVALAGTAGCGVFDGAQPDPREAGPPDQRHAPERSRAAPLIGGDGRIVAIGDSLGASGERPYPERIPALLESRVGPTETVNLATAGTSSDDWLPGSGLFERSLAPELKGADVILVSIGGTDLEQALGASDGPDALDRLAGGDALDALRDARRRVRLNLRRIFAEVRRRSPRTKIVYVAYPDYSGSTVWRQRAGALATLALRAGLAALVEDARSARPDAVVDMLAITGRLEVDSLLADGEHLSGRGHALYARAIAAVLAAGDRRELRRR